MEQAVADRNGEGVPWQGRRSLYEADLYAWAMTQSDALRHGRASVLDLPNLIDEVGGIARHEVRRLERRLERLCHQLMLWDYGHGHRTRAKAVTIVLQRLRVWQLLARCPSLARHTAEALDHGYDVGRYGALREDERLPEAMLPDRNPYSWTDAMTRPVSYTDHDGCHVTTDHMVLPPRRRSADDHADDVHAWALQQEKALVNGRFDHLDLRHLADEMAASGNREDRAFESALLRLLQHTLKWDHQPARRSRSWHLTIKGQRGDVLRALNDNPSLRVRQGEAVREAYRRGRNAMMLETGMPDRSVPHDNPYSWDEIMTRPVVWPEP